VTRAAANGTTTPTGVFDLDAAVEAAKAEAGGEPFVFTWKGTTYEVPTATEWPMEALTALADGNLPVAMGALLGEEAYGDMIRGGITVGGMNTLFDAIGKAAGMGGLPNSLAPPQPASTRM
jgi:hypothetical protein